LLMVGLASGIGASMAGWGVLAGLAVGCVLGIVGLRMTRFETVAGRHWYTPHPGIGLVLTALMLGRLVYRFFAVRATTAVVAASEVSPLASLQRSPLTLAIAGLLIGYYLANSVGLLRMARRDDLNALDAKPE
jgi:cytochrome b561